MSRSGILSCTARAYFLHILRLNARRKIVGLFQDDIQILFQSYKTNSAVLRVETYLTQRLVFTGVVLKTTDTDHVYKIAMLLMLS